MPDYFTRNKPNNSYFPPCELFAEDGSSVKLLKLHGSINWKTIDGKTFIVPPTWNKSDPEIRLLWEKAYTELMTAKRVIVIGYSFPEADIYVKSLLGLALNENKILQNIYFVNPDKDLAKRTCLSLLDKYFEKYCGYKEWKFSEFIGLPEGRKFIRDAGSKSGGDGVKWQGRKERTGYVFLCSWRTECLAVSTAYYGEEYRGVDIEQGFFILFSRDAYWTHG